jgi:hypothetical protein
MLAWRAFLALGFGVAAGDAAAAEFRAIRALAAFDFDELRDDLPVATVEIGRDGGALRFQPKPALALPVSADPVVRDLLPRDAIACPTCQRLN